ncbi:hypothetical protein KRP22_002175 [Phytophthora ramorum]|nr:hypothetical protein KRP22_1458 [Phytophthora ramorum]
MSDDGNGEYLRDQEPDLEEDFNDKEWPFSDKGYPGEVPEPTGDACIKISDVLGGASEHSGGFSFGGHADQLPPIPGLFVDEVGPIPVPLWEESAQKLIEKCERSPFGHNFDTKLDENVRKSWQVSSDQGVPLHCVLYKLLVYGEGGHFVKHQDTEKEDGMIATLVVQPPSLHEGGDLVVYRDGEVKHRHDFGKAEGRATYLPHYAVRYADAEHSVEKVTKGYRLALVYSVCLPATMLHRERNPNKPMSGELADAIASMGPDDDTFALLLDHEYTERSIKRLGVGALKGVDRVRFQALQEANGIVADDKRLDFYIAKLVHEVHFHGIYGDIGDWEEARRDESMTAYSTDGGYEEIPL